MVWLNENYLIGKKIGQGTYGKVYCAKSLNPSDSGFTRAIKRIHVDIEEQENVKMIMRELYVLSCIHHPYILQLNEVKMDEINNFLYIVTPLFDCDLQKVVKTSLSIEQRCKLMACMVAGVSYMHENQLMHRDLKPANILVVAEHCIAIIADFSLVRSTTHRFDLSLMHPNCSETSKELSNYVVTRWYRSWEVLLQESYCEKIDCWALGCIFAEMIQQKVLFPGTDCRNQLRLIKNCLSSPYETARRDMLSHTCYRGSTDEIYLMESLLRLNPLERISLCHAKQHAYFEPHRDLLNYKQCPGRVPMCVKDTVELLLKKP